MRILILNWRCSKHPRAGGADFRLQNVYAPLVKMGHEVVLYCCAFPGCDPVDQIDGIEVHRLGTDATFSFLCAVKLRGWAKAHRSDVVVEDLNKLPFYSPVTYRGPLVIQMHHLWRGSIFREAPLPVALLIWLSEEMIRIVYRRCQFSVVSESTQRELQAMGVKSQNIKLIYNGADLERYRPAPGEKEMFLLWIGRIQKYKGPIEACKILEKLLPEFPSLRLVIVGDGPFLPELKRYILDQGLSDHVQLTGFIDEEEKISLLQRAAVHIQSSYKEGWGLSVIEANACGCPVVANNAAGLRDSCRDGETGLLYRYCDEADGAGKVRMILTDDPLRRRLVEQGERWSNSFSWARNADEMLAYLQVAIDRRSPS